MSLILATGSNLGPSLNYLLCAKLELCKTFELIAESRVYRSQAVDFIDQPDFFNQVLEFRIPCLGPGDVLEILRRLELASGRVRDVSRGPRTIDLDIIFWGLEVYGSEDLSIPHPRWSERSFVVKPLMELPFFQTIEKCFTIPQTFTVDAFPL